LLTLVALVWLWERAPEKLEKDVGHGLRLPLTLGDTRSAGWLGAVMFLLVDAALFVSLIYAFFYLWTSSSLWPPIGYASDAGAPVLAAAALLSILVPAARSAHIRPVRRRPALALSGLAAMIVLSAVLLYAGYLAIGELPFNVRTHAYGAVVAGMLLWHVLHAALVLLAAGFALARVLARGVVPLHSLAPRVAA